MLCNPAYRFLIIACCVAACASCEYLDLLGLNEAAVASVAVSPSEATVQVGETLQFAATLKDSGGKTLTGRTVTWASSAPEVGHVSETGLLSGMAAGSATITATSDGVSGAATVTVQEGSSGSLITNLIPAGYEIDRLELGIEIYVDRTYTITGVPGDFEDWLLIKTANEDKSRTENEWLSFDLSSRATVGVAYDLRATSLPDWLHSWPAAGRTIQTTDAPLAIYTKDFDAGHVVLGGNSAAGAAGAESNYVVVVDESQSTPPDSAVASVTVSPQEVTIEVGATAQLTATLKNSAGETLTGRTITWGSNTSAIATVNATGLVSGVSPGSATITATSEGVSGSAAVVVVADAGSGQVGLYDVFEASFEATGSYANPYLDASMTVSFAGPSGQTVALDGFWDGGNTWKVRMAPTKLGTWTYTTSSSDPGLDGKSGSFEAVSSTNRGHIRVSQSYPHTFEYADGTPFFWLADTNWDWANLSTPFDGTFENYVDTRAAQRFTVIQGTLEPTGAGGRGAPRYSGENEGGAIFANYDVENERLNPNFFQWMDKRVEYIMDTGLALAFWYVWANDWNNGASGQKYKRYARYVIARYTAYTVFWGVMGEYEEIGNPGAVRDAGQFIKTIDPYQHPLTTHTLDTTADDFGNESWIDFHGQQEWTTTIGSYNQAAIRDRSFGKPVVQLEIGYEDELGGAVYRKGGWAFLTGGGFFTYGERRVAWDKPVDWTADLNTPGANQMAHVRAFWANVEWWRMEPDNGLVTKGFCLTRLGAEYVIYLPNGGSVTVDLSAATGNLRVEWFNPRTGATTSAGTVGGGGSSTLTAPNSEDWVLHLER